MSDMNEDFWEDSSEEYDIYKWFIYYLMLEERWQHHHLFTNYEGSSKGRVRHIIIKNVLNP